MGSENKTQPCDGKVEAYLQAIADDQQRDDAFRLHTLLSELSGEPALIWGRGLIGFGRYHYRYDSGREGDFFRVGFAARKGKLAIYIIPGFDDFQPLLERLGRHSTGRSCLYVRRLDDVDLSVLTGLVVASLAVMRERYPHQD